jgi:hypothetical protein
MSRNINTSAILKNTEVLLDISKEVGLEVTTETNQYCRIWHGVTRVSPAL